MTRASYPKSFKLAVVKEVVIDGQTQRATAIKNGITPVTVKKWVDKYRDNFNPLAPHDKEAEAEILRKRLHDMKMERDALKTALYIVMKDTFNEA